MQRSLIAQFNRFLKKDDTGEVLLDLSMRAARGRTMAQKLSIQAVSSAANSGLYSEDDIALLSDLFTKTLKEISSPNEWNDTLRKALEEQGISGSLESIFSSKSLERSDFSDEEVALMEEFVVRHEGPA